ncbi:hypothetical protein BBK36DRAFT_24305 [Trichoderma citrinoviride]|uniref:Uncharacterized protein n=1 Tax=Trichoderma citrinoviride TaxID=58853 RepID=A0A2T4AX55_9HYPO|nr:hypothetical protein BBK36DRAFT_24305 [Trichoderma citrinoviride]PTB61646.1 hypothetical protein BBK36DRAFT_24305 [Trichoderma citrinoviride]
MIFEAALGLVRQSLATPVQKPVWEMRLASALSRQVALEPQERARRFFPAPCWRPDRHDRTGPGLSSQTLASCLRGWTWTERGARRGWIYLLSRSYYTMPPGVSMDTMDTGSKLWMDGHDGYVCYDMTMITADPADRPAAFVRSNCLNIAGRSRRFMRSSSLRHSSQVTLSTAAPAAASCLPTLIHNGLLLHTFTTATCWGCWWDAVKTTPEVGSGAPGALVKVKARYYLLL